MEQKTLPLDNFPDEVTIKTRVPFGYKRVNQSKIAKADPKALEALTEAFDQLDNGDSVRNVETTLKGKGHDLSRTSILKLWRQYRPDSPGQKKLAERKLRNVDVTKARKKWGKLTKAQKDEIRTKRKIAAEKRRITAAKKRLDNLTGEAEKSAHLQQRIHEARSKSVIEYNEEVHGDDEVLEQRPVVFKPNDGPQTDFLAAPELEVLYGGAAGGGKSYALIADPLRYVENKNFVGLLLRRTNDELRELIWKSKELYPQVYPKAIFREKDSEWRFPSGSRLWMTYLDKDDDVGRYHGQTFTWIGFDELTQWPTPFAWDYLRHRLRTTDPTLEPHLAMRATTNPGGVGHGWVKKMFIDPAVPGQAFWARDLETGETLVDPENNQPLFKRRFIPARLSDNPYLSESGRYRLNLLSLPESKRKQFLEGDWSIADGAAFPEFRESVHVVEPFEIPSHWSRFRAMDYGYQSNSCVLWFAVNPSSKQLVVYRELYVSKKTGEEIAMMVRRLEQDEKVSYGVLDSSVWHKRGEGPSVAEVMIGKGCKWRPADRSQGSRVAGKNRIHELLKVDEFSGEPGIVFFNTCRQVISDLQVIPADPKGSDDIDPRFVSDHSYDTLRYGVMSRPRSVYEIEQNHTPRWSAIQPADRVFGY